MFYNRMMPGEMLHKAGIQRIIGSGSIISKNHVIKTEIEKCFKLPLVIETPEDSAFGAALAVFKANQSLFS